VPGEITVPFQAKAAELGAGKFVYNLGGWSYDQFADNPTPLTKAELDAAAPNNPAYLQFSRCCAFMNSKAIDQLGIDAIKEPWVERDAAGKPTATVDLALHLGEVLYGNVGSVDRLDFTVIGPARLTAMPLIRLSKYCGRSWSGMMA